MLRNGRNSAANGSTSPPAIFRTLSVKRSADILMPPVHHPLMPRPPADTFKRPRKRARVRSASGPRPSRHISHCPIGSSSFCSFYSGHQRPCLDSPDHAAAPLPPKQFSDEINHSLPDIISQPSYHSFSFFAFCYTGAVAMLTYYTNGMYLFFCVSIWSQVTTACYFVFLYYALPSIYLQHLISFTASL